VQGETNKNNYPRLLLVLIPLYPLALHVGVFAGSVHLERPGFVGFMRLLGTIDLRALSKS